MMPIRYTNKYAIYQFCYYENGMLKSEAVRVKIVDVINTVTEHGRVKAIVNLNTKYNYPIYSELDNKTERLEAGIFGCDMMETIVDTISPLIGV